MQDFAAKQNALFACLDDASKELKGTQLDQSSKDQRAIELFAKGGAEMVYRRGGRRKAENSSPDSLSRLRGKESIFKKPELPIGKCLKPRKTPDYQLNPHKWKKYSLSDVDISDHTNTSAAFAFLKQIDEQRDEAQSTLHEENAPLVTAAKIEFKKSSKIRRSLKAIEEAEVPDAELDKPKLKGSKLVMPEYVIGQRKEKIRRVGQGKRAAGNLTLSHLQAEEDEDEEQDEA